MVRPAFLLDLLLESVSNEEGANTCILSEQEDVENVTGMLS